MKGLLPAHSLYSERLKWYMQVLTTNTIETDGPLALVLYMAVNIRELQIADQGQMYMTRKLMGVYWSGRDELPFQKLEVLEISGGQDANLAMTILPSMTFLKVSNDDSCVYTTIDIDSSRPREQYFITPAPLPACPSLSKLELSNIGNIDAIDVAAMVASPWLANLRDLSVYSCYKRRSGVVGPNIMSNLLRALERNVPFLEAFDWTQHKTYGPNFGQFDTFRGLKNLQCLLVDFRLLVPPFNSTLEILDDLHLLFPASLRKLILDNFTVAKIHSLVSKFHRAVGDVGNLGEAVSKALKHLAAKFEPLQRLTLGIDMEGDYDRVSNKIPVLELAAEDVVFLRYAADELVKTGLKLRVERMPGFYDGDYKTLVEPGYTAPLPHSVTSDDGD
ncbi:hypothetical protein FB567DRAFT_607574 [Paraphoma chrysanthemicola]|uniref:F-box domain-containing protein n=1 Tax=Paraphoma chrysanthemicola TaxID=798071 RepID=A0A8K0R0J3_9PLEO|nr:hypothetical protein FB567DRAFT_607574 [Paraphoma chrysanthemicola]